MYFQLTWFCTNYISFIFDISQVPSGEYRLSALAAQTESTSGLMFLPTYIDVTVKSPLLNIEFSQVNFKNS